MTALKNIYRRLDRMQRSVGVRIAASVLALAVCGVVFGALIGTARSLETQRVRLVETLAGQSAKEGDPYARALLEEGTITLDGRTYGGPYMVRLAPFFFDAEGAVALPGALAERLLADQYPRWAPTWMLEHPGTTWMLAIVVTAWLLLIVWIGLTLPFLLTLAGTAVPVGVFALLGSTQWMWAFGGMGLLTFTFVLLTRTALVVYHRPNRVLAVAHTVLKEASRSRISLVFIIVILILLPLLPLGLDAESPLRYRIQTFISRSLGFTFYLAACMTLFLSCATVAFEIRDRQIWQLVTKPVSRLSYLLGKWLGVVTVNLIILSIAAVSIFTFIQYLREQPVERGPAGEEDRMMVRDAVLTARVGAEPVYSELTPEQIRERVVDQVQRTPELAMLEKVPVATLRDIQDEIVAAYAAGQRTIPPQTEAEYRFEGLGPARGSGSALTLRYHFHIMRDDEHETFHAIFYFNGDRNLAVRRTYVPTLTHVLAIPPDLIRDDGSLTVTIVNPYVPPSNRRGAGALNFEEKDFELLYRVGSFEGNFVRAVAVDWIKLAFLAMLGICTATFLSFPVACLTSFTVFAAGTIGPFLAISLAEYYPPETASVDWANVGLVIQWAFMSAIRVIAQVIVFLLQSFGEYRPTQSLVEGRLIPWSTVVGSAWKVGLLWSGLSLLVGYAVIRRRQLAIYSGQG